MTGDRQNESNLEAKPEAAPWDAVLGSPSPASEESASDTVQSGPDAHSVGGAPRADEGARSEPSAEPEDTATDDEATQVLPAAPPALADEPATDADALDADGETSETVVDREWMGVTAYIAALLALSPVAIVLGHLGLSAAQHGRARHRSFALAAVVLGWITLAATALGLWFLLNATVTPEEVDVQAQQDVSAVGAAAATLAVDTNAVPVVSQIEGGYAVGDEQFDAHLSTAHELSFTGTAAADWCLDITFEGGTVDAFSYTATGGMAQGACSS